MVVLPSLPVWLASTSAVKPSYVPVPFRNICRSTDDQMHSWLYGAESIGITLSYEAVVSSFQREHRPTTNVPATLAVFRYSERG